MRYPPAASRAGTATSNTGGHAFSGRALTGVAIRLGIIDALGFEKVTVVFEQPPAT